MRRMKTLGGCLAALVLTLGAPTAQALPADVAAVQVGEVEAADAALMTEAFRALNRGGYAALDPFLPGLREALDRTPAAYPFFSVDGDVATLRSSDMTALIMATVMAGKVAPDQASVSVVQAPNVYPMIALLLTSEAVQRGRYDEAIGYADRGLAVQPDEPQLNLERGIALHGAGRVEEALANIDAAIDNLSLFHLSYRGPMLRQRGFMLIELGRLDEAEAAYREVLEDEPDNEIALGQLQYIESQRAGAPPSEPWRQRPPGVGGD